MHRWSPVNPWRLYIKGELSDVCAQLVLKMLVFGAKWTSCFVMFRRYFGNVCHENVHSMWQRACTGWSVASILQGKQTFFHVENSISILSILEWFCVNARCKVVRCACEHLCTSILDVQEANRSISHSCAESDIVSPDAEWDHGVVLSSKLVSAFQRGRGQTGVGVAGTAWENCWSVCGWPTKARKSPTRCPDFFVWFVYAVTHHLAWLHPRRTVRTQRHFESRITVGIFQQHFATQDHLGTPSAFKAFGTQEEKGLTNHFLFHPRTSGNAYQRHSRRTCGNHRASPSGLPGERRQKPVQPNTKFAQLVFSRPPQARLFVSAPENKWRVDRPFNSCTTTSATRGLALRDHLQGILSLSVTATSWQKLLFLIHWFWRSVSKISGTLSGLHVQTLKIILDRGTISNLFLHLHLNFNCVMLNQNDEIEIFNAKSIFNFS